ncbi:MAG: hypothetical protein LBT86_07705 [Deltaproteobacteria bacterium]|jgi:hypothetical protein|nr:hypothetical protein [Deltaproteobacteria bacterium]
MVKRLVNRLTVALGFDWLRLGLGLGLGIGLGLGLGIGLATPLLGQTNPDQLPNSAHYFSLNQAGSRPDSETNAPAKPPGLDWPANADAARILSSFLGLSFRVDGVINDQGAYSSWAKPNQTFRAAGFNCSGFIVSLARFIWNENLTLADTRRDRLHDSNAASPLGLDWDFGLDVALNIAEKRFIRYLPEPTTPPHSFNDAQQPVGWGVNINSPAFLTVLRELMAERIYIFVISKPDRRFLGKLSYYHTGFVLVDPQGAIWLYHATARAGVHRINLAQTASLATFRRYYPPVKNGERRILFLELALPSQTRLNGQ